MRSPLCGLLSVALAVLSLSGEADAQQSKPTTNPALDKLNAEFVAAFNAKDAAKLASFYTEDATLMPPNAPMVKGRPNIEAFWRSAFDQGLSNLKLRPFDSAVAGDQGYEAGTATMDMKPAGKDAGAAPAGSSGRAVTDTSKYVVVFKRVGQEWRMAYAIFNSDAAPAGK